MTTLISKLLLLFVTNDNGQVTQAIITSSLEELASSSSSSSSPSESPSLSLSSDASGEEKGDATKPPRQVYHQAIQLTQVFTWHNSSLNVSRQASMRWTCAMTASKVTLPFDEEGVEEAGGVAVSFRNRFGRSWALLRWTAAASNGLIVRQWMESECHHHVKEPRTFFKAWVRVVLTVNPRRCLTKVRREFVFGHSPKMLTVRVVNKLYPQYV